MKAKFAKTSGDDFIILTAEYAEEEKKLEGWSNSVVSTQFFPKQQPSKKQSTLLLCREVS